jgi:ABC-type multidrug transport system fused ATPase/permease subunit
MATLVGANGAGKSTLAKLVAGLYAPTEGSVVIDGVDVRTHDQAELYRHLAFMPQELFRFEATVHENIAIGSIDQLLGRTAFLISQRFALLGAVDRILVMDSGRIIEQGTHKSLMRDQGVYASLYRSTVSRYDISARSPDSEAA